MFDKLLFEQKYQSMKENMWRIESAFDDFSLILMSYSEQDELVAHLKDFGKQLRDKHYDSEIIKPVTSDEEAGGSQSVVTSYISFITHNDVELKCSVYQQIDWFYNHVLQYADDVNVLILTHYELLETIEQGKNCRHFCFC